MNYLLAKNDEQLGKCIRMLFSDKLNPVTVQTVMNKDRELEYRIMFDTDEILFEEIERSYEELIGEKAQTE